MIKTLCISCDPERFYKCRWVRFGKEVEGWKAKTVYINNDKKNLTEAYCVLKCPNYLKDKKDTHSAECKYCHKQFMRTVGQQKFCCKEHQALYQMKINKGVIK